MVASWAWIESSLFVANSTDAQGSQQLRVPISAGQSVQRIITMGELFAAYQVYHSAPGAQRIGCVYSMTWTIQVAPVGLPSRYVMRRQRLADNQNDSVDAASGVGTANVMTWTWPWDWWSFDAQVRELMPSGGDVLFDVQWSSADELLTNVDRPPTVWTGQITTLTLVSSTQ